MKAGAGISFYFAVVLDYQGYNWLFATNIKLEMSRATSTSTNAGGE